MLDSAPLEIANFSASQSIMSPPSLRQWMHEAPRRPSSPGSLHERMAAMENALFELREAILSRGAPSEPTPNDARAVSAEAEATAEAEAAAVCAAEEQQLAAASGANRTSWLQRGLSNKKNRVPSSRLKGSGRIAGAGTPRLGLARSCPPPPATALSTSTAASSHEDDVAMEKEQGSSWDELGSLDLFGDLYEGGHAGHHRNDGHAQRRLGYLVTLLLLGWDQSAPHASCVLLPSIALSFLSIESLRRSLSALSISVIEDANGSHREYCKRVDMLQTWMAQSSSPSPVQTETYHEIPGAA